MPGAYVPPHLRRAAAEDEARRNSDGCRQSTGTASDRGGRLGMGRSGGSHTETGGHCRDSGHEGSSRGRYGGGDARRYEGDDTRRYDGGDARRYEGGESRRFAGGGRYEGGGSVHGGHGGGASSRRTKGAPSRFGSIGREMHGALRPGQDIPGARCVDNEGMVYQLADGSVRYFQDRGRKYPFDAGQEALPLLRGLLATNQRVFALSRERVEATGDAARTLKHGEALYADKPTMKAHHGARGTWSDEEYAHPGLQAVYLRLKSFQRFTESWGTRLGRPRARACPLCMRGGR